MQTNLPKVILTLFIFFLFPLISSAFLSFPNQIDTKQERINVQTVLNNVMTPSPNLVVDGVLGRKSIQAVQAFQEVNGLTADGKIGPITRAELEKVQTLGNTQTTRTQTNINTSSSLECTSGALFSIITGKSCSSTISTLPSGCTSTTLFSPVTGVSCGNMSPILLPTIPITTAPVITPPVVRSGGGGGSSSPTPTCSGSTSQSCTITNGQGSQSRTCTSGTWSNYGTCTPVSCNTGYQISGNTCALITLPINSYTLTYGALANGSLTGTLSQTVNYGASGTTINAVPNAGSHFVSWSDSSITNPRTDTNVISNKSISATFAINTYTIVSSSGSNGTITPSGTTTKNYATSQTYTITPSVGYHINSVLVDNTSQGTVSSYTFSNVTANHTISATFAVDTDTTKPVITAFTIPSTSSSLTVTISSLTATDNTSVTGYLLTETSSTPSAGSGSWTTTASSSYTFLSQGSKTLYSWAKDGAGNVSTSINRSVTITLPTTGSNTYYISSSTGNDGNNGTSSSTPWKTIAKVNAQTFLPGNSILFKRGDEWREQITVNQSGSSGAYITYSAYGNGNIPIINGADIITGWSNVGSNVWSVNAPAFGTYGFGYDYMVIVSGNMFTPVGTLAEVTSSGKFFIDKTPTPDKVYIYSTTNPASTVEVSARMFGAFVMDKTYIKFENMDFRNTAHVGLLFYATTGAGQVVGNSLVSHCNFYRNRDFAILFNNGYSNNIVQYSSASYNGNGFYSWSDQPYGSDDNVFTHCVSHHNIYYLVGTITDGHGFGIYNSDDNIVEYSESSYDQCGIQIDAHQNANDVILRYNYIHDTQNGSPGIGLGGNIPAGTVHQAYYNIIINTGDLDIYSYPFAIGSTTRAGKVYIYNNVIYQDGGLNHGKIGSFMSTPNGVTFKNNIVYVRGSGGTTGIVSGIGKFDAIDNNLYYFPDASASPRWITNWSTYYTLSTWQAAVSDEENSMTYNPLLTNPTAFDFSLQTGSPAINAGVNVGLTSDYAGNPIIGLPDIGAYEYGGVLGVSTYNFTLNLKYGSTGNEVKELQKILISDGYLSGTRDGIYGILTLNAVKEYQKANGLTPDGIIGSSTREVLNR